MIYFISSVSDKSYPVKIGFSKTIKGCQRRLQEIQTGNPERLRIIAIMEGDQTLEKEIHSDFDLYKINGEWFVRSMVVSGLMGKAFSGKCNYWFRESVSQFQGLSQKEKNSEILLGSFEGLRPRDVYDLGISAFSILIQETFDFEVGLST